MRIVTPDEMRALEARYMADSGITSARLMGRAADGLLKAAIALMGRDEWPPREMNIPSETARLIGLTAIVCCGPGANGGDGWALAWRLCDMHCAVAVLTVGEPQPGSAAHDNYLKCLKAGRAIRIIDLKQVGLDGCEDGGQILAQMKATLGDGIARAQLCVDAMFGTGFARAMSGAYLGMARMMRTMRGGGARVLAVDVPSGLSGLTGEDMGACPADATVTFQFIKRGQLLKAGQDLCGRLICHDIGIPERYAPEDAPTYVQADDVSLPRRRHDSHKGTYGHLLMIAGSTDYAGAALMAVSAALRAGAGLVSSACVRDIRQLMRPARARSDGDEGHRRGRAGRSGRRKNSRGSARQDGAGSRAGAYKTRRARSNRAGALQRTARSGRRGRAEHNIGAYRTAREAE